MMFQPAKALFAAACLLTACFSPISLVSAQDTPVSLTFTSSPRIVQQKDNLRLTIGIDNNTRLLQTVWLQVVFKDVGLPLYTSDPIGPIPLLPFFSFSEMQTVKVPKNLLPGLYTVEISAGPSKLDPKSFDSASDTVTVLIDLPGPLRRAGQK